MPTVFASVSFTILLFYIVTLGLAYGHVFPVSFHMLWGLFMTTLVVLLQCLIFGFFIGSGKSIKRVVQENGLTQDWIQKTKDYKNQSYPALMLAIVVTAAAGIVGGGIGVGAVPVWVHQVLVWVALALNARSLWISYKVIVENVNAIHRINREVQNQKAHGLEGSSSSKPVGASSPSRSSSEATPATPLVTAKGAANFYFLAMAVWVPYLYMKWSLGSRTFPFWPFLALSGFCALVGWWGSRRKPNV
jgi:hypothetical protein